MCSLLIRGTGETITQSGHAQEVFSRPEARLAARETRPLQQQGWSGLGLALHLALMLGCMQDARTLCSHGGFRAHPLHAKVRRVPLQRLWGRRSCAKTAMEE